MARIKDNLDEINANNARSTLALVMYLTVTERALALRNLILLTRDEDIPPDLRRAEIGMERERIKVQAEKYAAAESKLTDMFNALPDPVPEERSTLAMIRQHAAAAVPYYAKALELIDTGKGEDAYKLLRFEFRPIQKNWWSLMRELIELEEKRNGLATANADRAYDHGLILMLAFGGIAFLFSMAAACLINRYIADLRNAERRLRQSHARLHALSAHREVVQEEERKNIARELHDELGQILTALHMNVSVLRMKFGKDNPSLTEHANAQATMVETTMQVVRSVVSSLRPAELDMGIASALEWLVEEFSRHSGLECTLTVDEQDLALDEHRAMTVFRIVQESLTNVARHAQASRVEILLKRQGADCFLQVRDNGKGFDPLTPRPDSFGLAGIRERVFMLDGELTVSSAAKQGTSLEACFPHGGAPACA